MTPKYLSSEDVKSLFREANAGDAADEFKHTFSFDEFVGCVKQIVDKVQQAVGEGQALPSKTEQLRKMLLGNEGVADTQVALSEQATMQAQLIATYDNDNASDGVRVPVSTLWSSVREVESHLQTEEQLRTALDRLAGALSFYCGI